MYKKIIRITITLFTILLFLSMGIYEVKEQSQYSRLKKAAVESSLFRRQPVPDKLICRLRGQPDPADCLLYTGWKPISLRKHGQSLLKWRIFWPVGKNGEKSGVGKVFIRLPCCVE